MNVRCDNINPDKSNFNVMVMKDKALELKIATRAKVNKTKIGLKSSTIGAITDSSAKTAARQTKATGGLDIESTIVDLINKIDQSSTSGQFYIHDEIPLGALKKVTDYFRKKGYLIIRYKNTNRYFIFISWMGGKSWTKFNLGPDALKNPLAVGKRVFRQLNPLIPNNSTDIYYCGSSEIKLGKTNESIIESMIGKDMLRLS